MFCVAVALAFYGFAPNLALSVCALVVVGCGYIGILTGLNASVQLHAPLAERSRILSLYTLSLSLFYPLGAVCQAAIAHVWGVRPVTITSAAVLAAALIVVSATYPRFWTEIGSSPNEPAVLLAE
jgi:MFS family permease